MKGRPKGYKVSDKTKKLISKKLKGRIFSEETIEKMRIGQLNGNNNSRGKRGDKHFNWIGDRAGYSGIHKWIKRNWIKKGICSFCGKVGKTEWANKSGEYNRNSEDWVELCKPCHYHFDRNRND